MQRIFEVKIGESVIAISVDGLPTTARVKLAVEQGAGAAEDEDAWLVEWLKENVEIERFEPTPARVIYDYFIQDRQSKGLKICSANRMARTITDMYGRGRNVWIAETKKSVPAWNVKIKKG